MDRVLEVEPGDTCDETELVAILGVERRLELAKNGAVLDVFDPGLLMVCDFLSVEDEKSELSIVSDIREVDDAEDPFEEVTPTEFELDMSDAAVGVSSVVVPLPELDLMNNDLVKFRVGSDGNDKTT